MIECNIGECRMVGNTIVMEAEFALICRCMKEMLVKDFGEKIGNEKFNHCIELSAMTDEEIKRKNAEMSKNIPFLDALADTFMEQVIKETRERDGRCFR